MPRKIYTMESGDITPANSYASVNLLGFHITKNEAGTAYELTAPASFQNQIVATAGPPLPTLPFDFPEFFWAGVWWNVTVTTHVHGSGQMSGTWSTPGVQTTPKPDDTVNPQNGDFTAQTGGTVVPEEAANAAGQGKN